MCIVSNIGDGWQKTNPHERYPFVQPAVPSPWIWPNPNGEAPKDYPNATPQPTREEFEALKREMEALRKLLEAGKEFDEVTEQPDCEIEEKVALIRQFMKFAGVEIDDLLGDENV